MNYYNGIGVKMTVGDLINELAKYPLDKDVEIACTFDAGFGKAGGKYIEIIDKGDFIELFNDEC